MRRAGARRQAGFTLIEMMAAITIFSIFTLGLVPVFTASIKGASLSRTYTVGKNVAVAAMERARGLPFYVDYPTQKGYSAGSPSVRRVDLLDLYLPAAASGSSADGTGQYAGGTYTTICSSTTGGNPACPRALPPNYTLEFRAQFVRPVASGSNEQFVIETPPADYRWNPEPYASQDRPTTQLVQMTVFARWTYAGRPKNVQMSGLIGDRDFGEVTVAGAGRVDYAVQVSTEYTDDSTGQKTEVAAIAGSADSSIETKSQSAADQSVTAARITMNDLPAGDTGEVVELGAAEGAASSVHAPPDSTPSGASVGSRSAVHPVFGDVAGMDATTTSGLKVSVSQELPVAQGTFGFSAPVGNERLFYIESQLGSDNASTLRLDAAEGLLKFTKRGSSTIFGSTSAETTAVTSSARAVHTIASVGFARLRLLSTSFINGVITDVHGDAVHRSVVVINGFQSSVSCKATASSTATGTKSWSGTLYFWRDDNPNDDTVGGSYQRIDLSSGLASDPLASFGPLATNPVVYDAPLGEEDIYLFQGGGRRGYLQSWNSTIGETTEVAADGRLVSASVPEAIRIVSSPTDSRHPESALVAQIGKLSCEAQDQR